MVVQVTLFGSLTVVRDGEPLHGPALGTRKARVLLAVLAAGRGTPIPVDRLVDSVWPDGPPQDPAANVATLVSRLRRTLGDAVVVPGTASYALGREVVVDLDTAAQLLASASVRLARAETTLAVAAAGRALDLIGAEVADECAGEWADQLRREAAELRRDVRHLLVAAGSTTGLSDRVLAIAVAAADSDPYDERAHRDLVRVLVAGGRRAAALDAYQALAERLADELGTDPDPETRRLHLAVLRDEPLDEPVDRVPDRTAPALVGRQSELARLDRAWAEAVAGRVRLVLVSGVPGIGKTRLLAEAAAGAEATGGLVLTARCRQGERSLFLQPFVDLLRPVLLRRPEPELRSLLGGHLAALAPLLPELAGLFGVQPEQDVSHDLARRRSFDALVAVLAGLAAERPVLLAVDDLQYGADATADLLAHLVMRLDPARVLLVGATRTEGLAGLPQLTVIADALPLGPLPASAVDELSAAAGFSARAAEVLDRSQGHPLSVVASLQALAAGTAGVPENVAAAVAGQLAALDPDRARVALAASVLGSRVLPQLLARLVAEPEVDVVLACEHLVRSGLMTAAGGHYEFTNDLIQEAVLEAVATPLAIAYHRRAADLLADRPEEMAVHAHAAGAHDRAAAGYLQAGRTARRSAALDDAYALLGLAAADAEAADDAALIATVLLERARVQEARADFAAAEADADLALESATAADSPRLRMRAWRLIGGDVAVARNRDLDEVIAHNATGLRLAAELGDVLAASWFRSRIAVLESSRLRLGDAIALATTGVAEARAAGVPEALARSLDGLKSALFYSGDVAGLGPVLEELIPLLERHKATWLLQWALQESALVPAAAGDWVAARSWVDRALEINHETGYGAYAGFFHSQRSWLAWLAGDLGAALADGRRAVAETADGVHPWWRATAAGACATALLGLGRKDEAAELCGTVLEALGAEAAPAYRLRCLAPIAAATGDHLVETDRLVAAIQAPPGGAWVTGADVYDALATAWLAAGEPERAAQVLRPLLAATTGSWASVHQRARQRISATSAAARSAPSSGTGR